MNPTIISSWINQPGDYSGDTWHIAAALVTKPELGVFQTVSTKTQDSQTRSKQARAFYASIGLYSQIDSIVFEEDLANGLKLSKARDRVIYNRRNVLKAAEELQLRGITGKVHYVYQATSVVLDQLVHRGRKNLFQTLRSRFSLNFRDQYPEAAQKIENVVARIPKYALLVICRNAKYHPFYNASKELVTEFISIARCVGRDVVLVADATNEDVKCMADYHHIDIVDHYNVHPSINNVWGTPYIDMRATAYFWNTLYSWVGK